MRRRARTALQTIRPTSRMLAGVLASIRSTPFAHVVPRHHWHLWTSRRSTNDHEGGTEVVISAHVHGTRRWKPPKDPYDHPQSSSLHGASHKVRRGSWGRGLMPTGQQRPIQPVCNGRGEPDRPTDLNSGCRGTPPVTLDTTPSIWGTWAAVQTHAYKLIVS